MRQTAMADRRRGRRLLPVVLGLSLAFGAAALAQAPQPGAPPAPAPAVPAPGAPADPAAPAAPPAFDPNKPSADASGGVEVMLAPRPVLRLKGEATWDEGFDKLMGAFRALQAEATRLSLKPDGRPMAFFSDTDDQSFRYEAMLPLAEMPAGVQAGQGFDLAQSPAGKVMRFPHEGAYDDIDAAYEAITAFLDEKGLTAKGQFIEEYLNEPTGADDAGMKLNIFVFIE